MNEWWLEAIMAINVLELICLFGIMIIISVRADKNK